jgi:hypothetical protein
VVLAHEVEAAVGGGERAEAEQIDLEEPELLDVVFVPLDDGAIGHGGARLDGDDGVIGLVPEQEAARVDGQVPRAADGSPQRSMRWPPRGVLGSRPASLKIVGSTASP